jgi:hypothetical protein
VVPETEDASDTEREQSGGELEGSNGFGEDDAVRLILFFGSFINPFLYACSCKSEQMITNLMAWEMKGVGKILSTTMMNPMV